MKKSVFLIITIALCFVLLLSGCSENTQNDDVQNTTEEAKSTTVNTTDGEFCRVVSCEDDGIIVWAGEYDYIYIRNIDDDLDIKPLQTVVVDFSESDLKEGDGTFTDFSGAELCYSYILENPKSIRYTTSEEPTFG